MSSFNWMAMFPKDWAPLIAVFSMLAAILSGICAWLSYRLAESIRSELKSDEIIITGVLHNPSLGHPDHENCVIQTTVFNKSKRKAFISKVQVYNSKNELVEVRWSDSIDQLGNINGKSELIGIVDSISLYIRQNSGEAFRDVRVEITHSFNTNPLTLSYRIDPGWQAYFAK